MQALPPEWAAQSGVMLTWPHKKIPMWQPFLKEIDETFSVLASVIAQYEKVLIVCFDDTHQQHIQDLLLKKIKPLSHFIFKNIASNDVWARDHGPITVIENGSATLLDFEFNGWGNKYPYEFDDNITQQLHHRSAFGNIPRKAINMVLEGGSIEVDGEGTLLTTASCLLAKNRNPDLTQRQIEAVLKEQLGLKKILWLHHGFIKGDDTDGHIDTLARFSDANTICHVTCDDPDDEHFEPLKKMKEELVSFKNHQDEPYRLVALPLPKPIFSKKDGRRLSATYANFLIINGAVLVPTYNDAADEIALENIQACFFDRKVIGVPCRYVIENNGSLHCLTMQLLKEVNI